MIIFLAFLACLGLPASHAADVGSFAEKATGLRYSDTAIAVDDAGGVFSGLDVVLLEEEEEEEMDASGEDAIAAAALGPPSGALIAPDIPPPGSPFESCVGEVIDGGAASLIFYQPKSNGVQRFRFNQAEFNQVFSRRGKVGDVFQWRNGAYLRKFRMMVFQCRGNPVCDGRTTDSTKQEGFFLEGDLVGYPDSCVMVSASASPSADEVAASLAADDAFTGRIAQIVGGGDQSAFSCADVERCTTSPTSSPSTTPTTLEAYMDSLCTQGYVDCSNGNEVVNGVRTERTCATACNGECCTLSNHGRHCGGFTGKICKDGSCSGASACQNSRMSYVVGSCVGHQACYMIGEQGGTVGSIIRSCNHRSACSEVGQGNNNNKPTVGNIVDSCNEQSSCQDLARETSKVTGNIVNSCNGVKSCKDFLRRVESYAVPGYNWGVGISDCCNDENECYDIGNDPRNENRGKTLPSSCVTS